MILSRMRHAASVCVVGSLLAACSRAPLPPVAPGSASGSQGAAETPSTGLPGTPAVGDRGLRSAGLEAPDNEPKIVAALKKALACPWTAEDGFDVTSENGEFVECAAYNAWREDDLLGEDVEKGMLTLLNLLEDDDEKVRYLAVTKLPSAGLLYKDRATAGRIVGQAERETSVRVAKPLGYAVGWVRVDTAGHLPRIKKLAASSPLRPLREGIYSTLLPTNEGSREALDFYLESLRQDDAKMRYTVLLSLRGSKGFEQDICRENVRLLDDPDPSVLGLSAQRLGYGPPCEAQFDRLLAYEKRRAAAGGVKEHLLPTALLNACEKNWIGEVQRQEAEAIARSLASGKNDDLVRASALAAVMVCNPVEGRTFAQGFTKDPSQWVRDEANRRLKASK